MIYMRAHVCAPTRLSPPLSYVQDEVAAKRHEEEDGEEERGEEEDEGLEGARMPMPPFIQRRIDSILYDIIAKQEITAALISKYEELRAGTLPTGVSWGKKGKKGKKGTSSTLSTKQQLFNIKNSMYRLKKTDGQFVCPCDANP